MPFSVLAVAIIPAIATFVTGGIAVYAWQYREVVGARAFALCAASTCIWCFFSVFEFLSTDEATRIAFGKAQYCGIAFFPVFWFVFTLRYAQCDGWLNRRLITGLSVIPVASLILAWSDRWHGWIWSSATLDFRPYPALSIVHGWWFIYVLTPQCYVLLLSGFGVLLGALFSGSRLYRRQIVILLLAALFTFICNVLYVISGVTLYGLDLTPVGFAIAGIIIQLGLFRTQFLEIAPISYKTVFLNTADAVILLDAQRRIVDLNPSAQAERDSASAGLSAIGYSFEQIFPSYSELAYHPIFWEPGHSELTKIVQLRSPVPRLSRSQVVSQTVSQAVAQTVSREVKVRSLQSSLHRQLGWAIIIRDVTLENQQLEQLEQLAYVDSLTGLCNRRQLEEKAKEVFRERLVWDRQAQIKLPQPAPVRRVGRRSSGHLVSSAALLYIDLNHFKPINDDYGHEVGDVVLKYFAHCLKRSVRKDNMVVRLGGDEFAALLYQADRQAAVEVRDRLHKLLKNAVQLAGHHFTLSASIGIAYYPHDGHSLEALLRCADRKMYQEKQLLRGI